MSSLPGLRAKVEGLCPVEQLHPKLKLTLPPALCPPSHRRDEAESDKCLRRPLHQRHQRAAVGARQRQRLPRHVLDPVRHGVFRSVLESDGAAAEVMVPHGCLPLNLGLNPASPPGLFPPPVGTQACRSAHGTSMPPTLRSSPWVSATTGTHPTCTWAHPSRRRVAVGPVEGQWMVGTRGALHSSHLICDGVV